MSVLKTDVLIAGAGPTGVTAAIALAGRGVRCVLIDPLSTPSPYSRALIVHARTLELLQLWGLGQELVRRGSRSVRMEAYVHGEKAVQLEIPDLGIDDTAFPMLLTLSQAETEGVLLRKAAALGVHVWRPVSLVDFVQDEHLVRANLKTPDGLREVEARYLIGADGAHSVVRKGLHLSFEGDKYPQDFVVADLDIQGDVPRDRITLALEKGRLLAFFPLPNTMRLMTVRERSDVEAAPPSVEELQGVVNEMSPYKATLRSASWMSAFRLHHRGVDHYGKGRCFVAGDAAHIHSPAGGQGMNTGIQDSINLGWKLAQVVLGEAQPAILASYEEERLPVGQRLLSFTDRAFAFLTNPNPLVYTLRDLLIPTVAPFVLAERERRARAFRFASQLAIRYRHSQITRSARRGGHPGPGERAPDAAVVDPNGANTHLQAQLDGLRWTLLVFAGKEADGTELAAFDAQLAAALEPWPAQAVPVFIAAEAPVGAPLPRRAVLDERGEALSRYHVGQRAMVLLRPDAYVAWRSETWDMDGLLAWLGQWLIRR